LKAKSTFRLFFEKVSAFKKDPINVAKLPLNDLLFIKFLECVLSFKADSAHPDSHQSIISSNNRFAWDGDYAYFEMGCLTFSLLDRWLIDNYPAQREKILSSISYKLMALSAKAFAINNIIAADILDRRLSFYARADDLKTVMTTLPGFIDADCFQNKLFSKNEIPLASNPTLLALGAEAFANWMKAGYADLLDYYAAALSDKSSSV